MDRALSRILVLFRLKNPGCTMHSFLGQCGLLQKGFNRREDFAVRDFLLKIYTHIKSYGALFVSREMYIYSSKLYLTSHFSVFSTVNN
jgi:hypothetical protein